MRRNQILGLSAVAALGVAGVAVFLLTKPHTKTPVVAKFQFPKDDHVPRPVDADKMYGPEPKAATRKYQEFVRKYDASPDPVIQDQVGTARVKIGFLAAHRKDWTGARSAFLEAAAKTKGTGKTGDFGSVSDQGAYEAIVCLQASGKVDEARQQYTKFIQDRPLSPLCMACYRRLKKLNGGTATPEMDALIDTATRKQEANDKFESSVCGPKTLAYLCEINALHPGDKPHDYKAFATLCKTTEKGTTVEGMITGLKAMGVPTSAYRVNRQDLTKIATPAILLWGDHYLTLLAVHDRDMTVYDTLTHSERPMTLPELDNPDFYVNAILLKGGL